MNNEERPLTKKELLEVLGGFEARFDAKLDALEDGVREYVQDTETKLLSAFHEFTNTNNQRFKNLETFQSTTTERLAIMEAAGRLSALELRVAQLEKKLDRRQ